MTVILREIAARLFAVMRNITPLTDSHQLKTNSGSASALILRLLAPCRLIGYFSKNITVFKHLLLCNHGHARLRENKCRGFALLITLVVVSIVLAVGLSLLQVTMKQLSLSSMARESEIAIYAANTGLECMQYARAHKRDEFISGPATPPDVDCADTDSNPEHTSETTLINGDSGVFLYKYAYQYDLPANETCVDVSLYMADMREATADIGEDISAQNEGLPIISCREGTVCTTIFSRGYNRPCDQLNSIFTVQRELTIEY